MTATIRFDKRGPHYAVTFRYNPALVELLKDVVPHHTRSWDKDRREWMVRADHGEVLAAALREVGCRVVGLEIANWAVDMFRAVGPQRVPTVHRALTKILHPDNPQTGDTTLQRQLNDARNQLNL